MSNPYNGAATQHYYVEEVTKGVTPTNPAWTKFRSTSGFPNVAKDTLQSDELDGSNEIVSIRTGNVQVNGEIGIDLSQKSHDDLLASALASTWVAGSTTAAVEVTVADAGKTFTRTAGDYVADGFEAGQLVWFKDLSGNNAIPFHVTSVSTLVITGAAITKALTDEVVTTDIVIADYLETGNQCTTFSILTWLKGRCGTPDAFLITTGVEFVSYSLEAAVNANMSGSFPLIGVDQQEIASLPAGSTFNPDLTTKQFTGVDGKVNSDGVNIGFLTSMTVANDSSASAQFFLGSENVGIIERGLRTNTMSGSGLMADLNLYNKYLNDTDVSIAVVMTGIDGAMSWTLPKARLTNVAADRGAPTSITQTIEATGQGDTNNSSIVIQRLPFA